MSLNVNSGSQDYKNKLKKTMQQTFKIKFNRVNVKVWEKNWMKNCTLKQM